MKDAVPMWVFLFAAWSAASAGDFAGTSWHGIGPALAWVSVWHSVFLTGAHAVLAVNNH